MAQKKKKEKGAKRPPKETVCDKIGAPNPEASADSIEELLMMHGRHPVRVEDAKIINACLTLMENGFNEQAAFRATFPEYKYNVESPRHRLSASLFWRRPEVQDTLKKLVLGRTGPLTEGDMNWAIDTWRNWIELSVLDFYGMDGRILPMEDLKAMPRWMHSAIKAIEETEKYENVMDEESGESELRKVKRIKITLIDKERALHNLARAMKWITANMKVEGDDTLRKLADEMQKANARAERMAREKIIEHEPQQELEHGDSSQNEV